MKEIYKILNWIRSQKKKNKILVSKKSISNLVNWELNKKKISATPRRYTLKAFLILDQVQTF